MRAKDGSSVNGRTLEFGTVIDTYVCIIPRGYKFVGKTPAGDGLRYFAKYGVVGTYCFNDKVVMDGMNEMGLCAGAFYFPGFASYVTVDTTSRSKALSPADFVNWILTQFATLEEVRSGLADVIIAPTLLNGWGKTPPPMHYIVYDKEGNALVIEPLDETLVIHDNPIGVMTNSPTFDWHMANLRNYINLSPYNAHPITLRNVELSPFGQGSGMVGLPGDFTPPSRFVRAAIFSSLAVPVQSREELVNQTFHILNQFDIPIGVARQKENGKLSTDYTLLTCVKDPNALRYYYKSYEDQSIKWVALKDFDLDAKKMKSMSTKGQTPFTNSSATLK